MYGLPLTVIDLALGDVSINVLDWHVSREVPEIAVKGVVGTVKFAVYTAVPTTARKFER